MCAVSHPKSAPRLRIDANPKAAHTAAVRCKTVMCTTKQTRQALCLRLHFTWLDLCGVLLSRWLVDGWGHTCVSTHHVVLALLSAMLLSRLHKPHPTANKGPLVVYQGSSQGDVKHLGGLFEAAACGVGV